MTEHIVRAVVHSESASEKAFQLIDGLAINGTGKCSFKISKSLILKMHKMGWGAFYNLKNLPSALNNPVAIFKGLARDGHEHSYCYVAKVSRYWHGDGDDDWSESRPGLLFTIYMMGTFEIYSWKFEKSDHDSDNLPINHNTRYGELLWPKR